MVAISAYNRQPNVNKNNKLNIKSIHTEYIIISYHLRFNVIKINTINELYSTAYKSKIAKLVTRNITG